MEACSCTSGSPAGRPGRPWFIFLCRLHYPWRAWLERSWRGCASSSRVGYQALERAHSSFFLPGIISAPEAWCPASCPENGSGSGNVLLLASLTPGGAGSVPGPREIFQRQVCMSIPANPKYAAHTCGDAVTQTRRCPGRGWCPLQQQTWLQGQCSSEFRFREIIRWQP